MYTYKYTDDVESMLEIARFAFSVPWQDHPQVEQRPRQLLAEGKQLFGAYRDGRLVAGYVLYPFRMRFRRSLVPMGGIGFVCSRPEVRGQGAIRFLLERAVATRREARMPISVLYPFRVDFYRKYGWELFACRQVVQFARGALEIPSADLQVEARELAYPDPECQDFYNRYAETHYNFVLRGEAEWRAALRSFLPTEAGRGVVKFTRGREVVGLLTYVLRRRGPGDDPHVFTVPLLACRDEPAKWAMLQFLRGLAHQVETIELQLPLDQLMWPYLAHRPANAQVQGTGMIRVTSLEDLSGLEVAAPDMSVRVRVRDPQAEWNDGTFALAVDGGVLHVARAERAEVSCDVGTLSAVLSGFTSFQEMIACGRVQAHGGYRGQGLPKVTTAIADYF
ncbi:MAG: GNAT family N-acetyltransferase [Candidatus Bipolaricaulaceae bacterium]